MRGAAGRVLLGAAVVGAVDIAAVLVAWVLQIALTGGQRPLAQAALAAGLALAAIVGWLALADRSALAPRSARELTAVLLAALPAGGAILAGADWVGRGYLTGWGNLVALWLFQLAVHPPAGLLAAHLGLAGGRTGRP